MGGGRLPSDHIPSDTASKLRSIPPPSQWTHSLPVPIEFAAVTLADEDSKTSASSSDHPFDDSPPDSSAATVDCPHGLSPTCDCRRRLTDYIELMRRYREASPDADAIRDAKYRILRHNPGDWIEEVGGTTARDYEVPEATTLLLVGPRGSGKSTLVNRITRVFEDDTSALDRAQVSYNLSATGGTFFLRECMIPRTSKSLCIYDTRSFSTVSLDNYVMLERWMTRGVSHGEMVISDSDDFLTRKSIKLMSQQGLFNPCTKRVVNFVIFVVNGVSVLNCMESEDGYNEMLFKTFNYPFLSFKDDKPIVVITHGDELSIAQRAHIRVHLGELLGIPPIQQIFDIPGTNHNDTDLAIVDMLRYSIEHADRNLAFNQYYLLQGQRIFHRTMKMLKSCDITLDITPYDVFGIIIWLYIFIIWLCIINFCLRET